MDEWYWMCFISPTYSSTPLTQDDFGLSFRYQIAKIMKKKFIVAALFISAVSIGQAADWPNWRGPDHNGISMETDWFEKWGSSGPKRLWNASVGTGFATVSVAGGRVFSMGNKSNRDTVFALNETTGDILWRHSYSEALNPNLYDGGPNATPTVDGEYVYTLSKTGKAFCLEAATGDEVWNKDLKKLYRVSTPNWGFASSPLIHGDKVVYNVGSRGIALNKKTGSLKWKNGTGKSGYATPVPYDHRGTEAFIMFGSSSAYGVNAATGKQLWSKSFKTSASVNAADPVLYNGKIFLTSNSRDGELIELNGTSTRSKWKNRNMRIHFNAGVVIGDGSDLGGGASIMGTLSGGGTEVVSVGQGCLIGAEAGIGISLGNNCIIEAGLYVTAGTLVTTPDGSVVKALMLSGQNDLLFRRNSQTGKVEVIFRGENSSWQGLNEELHQN